jgi:hypothetical protein
MSSVAFLPTFYREALTSASSSFLPCALQQISFSLSVSPFSPLPAMSLQSFDESRFRAQVSATLSKLQTILDNTRAPQYPADVPVRAQQHMQQRQHTGRKGRA